MIKTELLKLRESLKKKKPVFIRQDAHKKIRLEKRWKKPRGHQSKLRLNLKGAGKKIQIGYKFPKAVRGLSKEGLKQVLVRRVEDLSKIDNKNEGIVIAKSVGNKKRIAIIKEAIKSGIKILNIKNADDYIKKLEGKMKEKKEKEKINKEKVVEKKEEKKVIEKKKEKLSDEERRKREKEEKDKVLTKKV